VAILSPGGFPQTPPGSTQARLTLYDVETGAALPLASGRAGSPENLRAGRAPGLSADGRTLVVAAEPHPNPREQGRLSGEPAVIELDPSTAPHFHLGGRVTLPGGWPLASAKISLGGGSVRTDRFGYFYMSGLAQGDYRLSVSKEGYTFEPGESLLSVSADETALRFSAVPEEILVEARQDLGMPYSYYRGCASPYLGCGGPYHGFDAGYCTDLVLDAYSWGLDFHIQYALDRDARAHPGHFYRWGNARNSHDMWRYFHYTGQVLTHQEPYQPGDIVFFDWERDGVMDHVALVSEVNPSGWPSKLLDATGVIDSNPTGLAAELPWEGFHEGTVWGHARWGGTYGAIREATPPNLEVLQIALDGPGVDLRLVDMLGREFTTGSLKPVSTTDGTSAPESIPGLQFWDLYSGMVVSLLSPRSTSRAYLVELRARDDSAYYLNIKSQVGGWTTRYYEPAREFLPQGQVRRLAIILEEENGQMIHQVVALD
jgi:cell wall-associated NlpC family hydrolase